MSNLFANFMVFVVWPVCHHAELFFAKLAFKIDQRWNR